jgi:pimeloyl-ACP methyl ester carboxylesterase
MTERICCFGPEEALGGVLTEPEPGLDRVDAPMLLLLNCGILHSVGPFGWYVTLARRFADQGISSFRFDISGIGESPPRADGRGKIETGVADASAAMEFLARERGAKKFVLVGLCSGAILAQQLAAHNSRVVGAVLIDGWGYRTTGYYLRHYSRRIFRWQSWANVIGRLFRTRTGSATGTGTSLEDRRLMIREFYFEFPGPKLGREQLTGARCHGARLLFVYTGGVERYFNHRRQFEEMFGRLGPQDPFEVDYMPAADHMFSSREPRLALFNRVENWFQRLPA